MKSEKELIIEGFEFTYWNMVDVIHIRKSFWFERS